MTENLRAYEIPVGKAITEGISLFANDERVGVFDTAVNNTHIWRQDFGWTLSTAAVAIFDFEGNAKVRIHTQFEVSGITIRPLAAAINASIVNDDGDCDICFEISEELRDKFGQFTVEFDKDRNRALHIFTGKIEEVPAGDVITVKAGTAHHGDISLEKGQTLFIEGGAAVYGRVYFADNTRVCGRGIVDGSNLVNWGWKGRRLLNPIVINECTNVVMEGVSFLNPPCYVVQVRNSSDVHINNIKIVSAKANSDGISIQSSDHVYIDNSFIRSWDDSIVIKSYTYNRNSYDIYVNNCQIWTDLAQCMELGFETNKGKSDNPQMYNIEFKNVTVLHQLHKASLSIHNADNTEIFNVLWENITIEEVDVPDNGDGWNIWLDITNVPAGDFSIPGSTPTWTTVQERSTIHDITFRNISVIEDKSGSTYRIWPVKEGVDVFNLNFENAYNYGLKEKMNSLV